MDVVTIVELDVPFCDLTYGSAPCEAAIDVTGTRKCYNSRRTCQDPANFTPSPLTVRFMRPSAAVDAFFGIPALSSIDFTPQQLNPGVDLGKRESVRITFTDCLHTDAGFDKYLADRNFNPMQQGTFFGRFRARYPVLVGAALRIRRGVVGQDPSTMETRHYVVESTAGPAGGVYTIVAKDALKFLDGDRAQAPAASGGILEDAIGTGTGPVTLLPSGIGDIDYPASGKVAIGGSEVCSFTRIGDVMTLTVRGESNTDAVEHSAEERVQLVLEYDGESVADIIYDLLTGYTDIDSSWLPLSDWQLEVDNNLGRLYSAQIAEPTSVRKLIDEIIEQAALVIWTDTIDQLVRLRVLRPIVASNFYDTDRMLSRSFRSKEQLKKRVSQAWTFYGLRNPLLPLDERTSYGGLAIDVDFEAEDEYSQAAIHQVYSRWILQTNRTAAERVNEILLARYRDPPRLLSFDLARIDTAPEYGAGVTVQHYELQDDEGALEDVEVMVVEVEPQDDKTAIVAEEITFGELAGDKIVFISESTINVNLRDLYDQIYTAPTEYDKVTFVIESGVYIGTPWRDFNAAEPPSEAADLENPDFEEGDTGWTFSGSGSHQVGVEYENAYTGTRVGTLGFTSNPNGTSGSLTNDARTPITEGEGAGFRAFARAPGGWGATEDAPHIRLAIKWYDGALSQIGTTYGSLLYGYSCFGVWTEFVVVGTAPAGAEYYTAAVIASYGDGGFYFDAVQNFVDEQFAVNVGDWPETPELCLINNGQIRAGGGRGGNWPDLGEGDGINGGTGIYTRAVITIENNGTIAGGGGGGGGFENGLETAGGGGGAGYSEDEFGNQTFAPGGRALIPAAYGDDGTVTAGGDGGSNSFTCDGGDPGQDGETPSGAATAGAGGDAGPAVNGDSYVIFSVEGTILGPRIN